MAKKREKTPMTKEQKKHWIYNGILWAIGAAAIVLILCWNGDNAPWKDTASSGWEAIGQWFAKPETLKAFAVTGISILLVLVLTSILKAISKGIGVKNKKAATIFSIIRSLLKWIAIFVAIFVSLEAWGAKPSNIFASIGILALIIGLGCQTLISDVVAGIFLVADNAFEVGDIVVIGDFRGTVTEIGLKSTKIMDAGGNVKIVANSQVSSLINLTESLSIAAITVSIPYEENLKRTETLLIEHLAEMKKNIPAIVEGPYYKGVEELGDSAVIIKIIAKVNEDDRFQAVRDMNRDMFIFLNDNNIVIPYPQLTITNGPNPADHPEWVDKEKEEAKALKKAEAMQEQSKDVEEHNV